MKLTWSEVKRRWQYMTDEQREAVKAKQQWEQCSRLAVAHDWPDMFPPTPAEGGRAMTTESYVPCAECEGDGCHGPDPKHDTCGRCGGSGCEPTPPSCKACDDTGDMNVLGDGCPFCDAAASREEDANARHDG